MVLHTAYDLRNVDIALDNVRRMFSDRCIPGEESDVTIEDNDSEFIKGFTWGDRWCVVVFRDVNKASMTTIMSLCDGEGSTISNAVVIYLNKCTTMASKDIVQCHRVHIEKFKVEELVRVPLLLSFMVSCKILDKSEMKRLEGAISPKKLPRIWTTDPLQRYFGAPVGSVYRIVERYGSLPPEIKYRLVSPSTV